MRAALERKMIAAATMIFAEARMRAVIRFWTAAVGCGISADLDGNGLLERVDRGAEFPPGTDVYGTCSAGRSGLAKIEISRLVSIGI